MKGRRKETGINTINVTIVNTVGAGNNTVGASISCIRGIYGATCTKFVHSSLKRM